jgi:hypothetical protein
MGRNSAPVNEIGQSECHDRADEASELLLSDGYAREMSGAPSIYAEVTSDTLDFHGREWINGLAAVVSYVCRYGGPPPATARTHGFPVGSWLAAQYVAQLSSTQRAALMAVPGVTLSRSPKSTVRARSIERKAAWIRIQAWAHARFIEK